MTEIPELLFSYGTLQLEAVQMATFGRPLAGTSDALRGFELASLTIEDPTVVAISGKAIHTMATFTGRASDVISGTVFAVTLDEIQNADKYEVAAVKRVAVVLHSGVRAWAYVDARQPLDLLTLRQLFIVTARVRRPRWTKVQYRSTAIKTKMIESGMCRRRSTLWDPGTELDPQEGHP